MGTEKPEPLNFENITDEDADFPQQTTGMLSLTRPNLGRKFPEAVATVTGLFQLITCENELNEPIISDNRAKKEKCFIL